MSREAMFWFAGAMLCIAGIFAVDFAFHPHIWGTPFLVPEFFCLARYSMVMRKCQ
jgi:hypothetical protein